MLATPTVRSPRERRFGGHLIDFNRDPLGFLTRCAREYGDVVPLRLGPFQLILFNSPQAIEEILVTKNRSFVKGRGLERLRYALGNGLLTSDGEFWRRQRRLAQPAFHAQRIQAYGEIMRDTTRAMLATWQAGQRRDVHKDMMALTMVIVGKALFDVDLNSDANDVRAALDAMMDGFNQRNIDLVIPEWVPTPARVRSRKANERLDEIVFEIIAQRRARPDDRGDLLSMLLSARDENGQGMTDQQLRDEVMTLFLAGHETTANTLSWTWMLLAQNPAVEAALHRELDRVLAGREPATEDLARLPHTNLVIQEALRLYPPAWLLTREASQDVEIAGYPIPAGTNLFFSQWVMQRDPRFYPEPERFWPERWTDAFRHSLPDFAYFPFGGGPRLCIGKPFALQEAALALAMIAQRFRLRLDRKEKIELEPSVTLRPARGIPMTIEERGG